MINDPKIIKEILEKLDKVSKEDLDKAIKNADEDYNNLFIHYGSDKFDINKFKRIKNHEFLSKPKFGLWASRVFSEFGWKDWCLMEDYRTEFLNKSFIFSLKDNARILIIDDTSKLHDLPKISEEREIFHHLWERLDFEKLEKDYDAIEAIVSNNPELSRNLEGWDCDSILIMNPNIIQK